MTEIIIGNLKQEKEKLLLEHVSKLFKKEVTTIIDMLKSPDVHYLTSTENSIGIEEVKGLLKKVMYKPFEELQQIAVIDSADSLTHEAQNALLKTLEEPPANTTFILIVTHEKKLLDTILSRGTKHYAGSKTETYDTDESENFLSKPLTEQLNIAEKMGEKMERKEIVNFLTSLLFYYKSLFEKEIQSGHTSRYLNEIEVIQKTLDAVNTNAAKKLALWNMVIQLHQEK